MPASPDVIEAAALFREASKCLLRGDPTWDSAVRDALRRLGNERAAIEVVNREA